MQRTEKWNRKVEAIKDKYKDRIQALMESVKQSIEDEGFKCEPVNFIDGDDYSWEILVKTTDKENIDEKDIEVSFIICESPEYDGSEDGINFRLDIVEISGRILGGMCPFNYTTQCWVDIDNSEEIENRFKLMEQECEGGIGTFIGENYAKDEAGDKTSGNEP